MTVYIRSNQPDKSTCKRAKIKLVIQPVFINTTFQFKTRNKLGIINKQAILGGGPAELGVGIDDPTAVLLVEMTIVL